MASPEVPQRQLVGGAITAAIGQAHASPRLQRHSPGVVLEPPSKRNTIFFPTSFDPIQQGSQTPLIEEFLPDQSIQVMVEQVGSDGMALKQQSAAVGALDTQKVLQPHALGGRHRPHNSLGAVAGVQAGSVHCALCGGGG